MILRPYQEIGRDFLAGRRFALLADEMRVGKTPQAILAAQKIGAHNMLVVCPAIAVEHWNREFRKWWTKTTGGTPSVTVMSYDGAKRNSTQLLAEHWDLIIVDECHFAKNPAAQRTKLIYGKDGLGHCTDRLWALSGTPAPKHAAELWPMLKAFGVTPLSYSAFVNRYCWYKPGTFDIGGTKQSAIPELRALLATCMLRRKRSEVAPEMPAIDFQFLAIEPVSHADYFAPDVRTEELERWIEDNPSSDRENRIEVAKAKALPLVENICFNIENGLLKQTVVFGWHTEPLIAVQQALVKRGLRASLLTGQTPPLLRTAIQDGFRQGLIDVVCGNILAAGTAIDLSAASHGYFLELDWVSGNNLQAANRLVSMDKLEKVTFDIATWHGSTDDRVQRVLMRRANELSQLY